MALTKDQLLHIVPGAKNSKLHLDELVDALNAAFDDELNGLTTVNRQAAFIAQCGHESGSFCAIKENLNYSAEGLVKIFHKYFPDLDHATPYARNPEKIANKVYASRMGNGDEHSGDGFKFRGRGFIQLTGHDNYSKCGAAIDKDLLNHPEYLETMEGALKSAIWFWNSHGLNALADADDILHMTKKINGGTIGLEDRKHHYETAKQVLGG
jgi:putative chitinase